MNAEKKSEWKCRFVYWVGDKGYPEFICVNHCSKFSRCMNLKCAKNLEIALKKVFKGMAIPKFEFKEKNLGGD